MLAVLALVAGLLVAPGVGDTVNLRGQSPGELVAVTLTSVVDPARGSDDYDQPAAGNRFVATQFRIANAGTVVFDDSPDNDVQLIDSRGQVYSPALATVAAGPSFP